MTINDLTRDQLITLKAQYIDEMQGSISYGELCRADELVTDDVIKAYYANCNFVDDDFGC